MYMHKKTKAFRAPGFTPHHFVSSVFQHVRSGLLKARKSGAGFTLIELLVVIAIIGILASIVLASLNSARVKSRDARRVADVKQVQLALELYYNDNAVYPATTSSLVPTYISVMPKDPQTGISYPYAGVGSGTCTSYHLGTALEQTTVTTGSPLSNDADGTAGTACTGSLADFSGADTQDCAGNTGKACYDVKP